MQSIRNNSLPGLHNITAILLAGGSSRRMGENKAMTIIRGLPLIQIVHMQLESIFDEVIISAGDTGLYAFLGSPIIPDEKPNSGPLMGLYSAMKAASNPVVFACACDIPMISEDYVDELYQTLGPHDAAVPITQKPDHYEPLFAFYKSTVIPTIENSLSDSQRRMDSFFPHVDTIFHPMEKNDWFLNLNNRDDLDRFRNNNNSFIPEKD